MENIIKNFEKKELEKDIDFTYTYHCNICDIGMKNDEATIKWHNITDKHKKLLK